MESQTCSSCNEDLTEGARCTVCNQSLHYHCAGITEGGYRKLGDRKHTWRCHRCRQLSVGAAQLPSSPRSPISESDSAILMEIRALSAKFTSLEGLKDEMSALRNEFADLKSSFQTQFDDMAKKFGVKIENMEQRILHLEKVQGQVEELRAKLDRMDDETESREQWLRSNNVEIKGIPQSLNENLFEMVTKIGQKINYPISKTQINFISRVPTREKDHIKPIIVGFCNRYVKEDFIAAARYESKSTTLIASHIGLPGKNKIFINDHLTLRNKMLLSKTKKAAAETDFRYVWVKHAKIHARKTDTSPVITVKTEKDLGKIV
ncbi:hypothetical protein PYW08_003130 [Mythimna loreyi]|uniref:Uncharacterized protein n=1 Tax=Mythimna loreyi TaxID=667449 RepID=A0ACC2QQD3_9NEOP|nr:hypothetical protein PYW08_003130 [Mythimna loreyi]